MKNTRALVMIGISFIVALAAVLIASKWVSEQAALSTSKVVVAAGEIDLGSRLTREMLRVADWPVGSVPAGAFKDDAVLVDRVVRTGLQRGEPVLETKLAPAGSKGGLSAVVAQGKRAMTVRVNDVIGVAGFALPGNFVDIMVNTERDSQSTGKKEVSVSKIVLENILVLAVAQEANRDETKPKVVNAVTLEVTPAQAETLDLARSVGTLSLVLRNQVDPKPAMTAGATKATLLGVAAPAADKRPVATTSRRAAAPRPAAQPAAQLPVPAIIAAQQIASVPAQCVAVISGVAVSRECF